MELMMLRICFLFVIALKSIVACWSHQIETDNLILRRPVEENRTFLTQLLRQPSAAQAYGEEEIRRDQVASFVRGIMRWQSRNHTYIIFLKDNNVPIGTFQVCYIPQCRGPLNGIPEAYRNQVCQNMGVEFGYLIDEAQQKKGYASEALAGFMSYISKNSASYFQLEYYEDVVPKVLYAMISRKNIASIRVAEKNGFKLFGNEVNELDQQLYYCPIPEINHHTQLG